MEQQDLLSEDVINQLKNLSPSYHDLTKEQKTFVDKLIVNDQLIGRYQRNQLCDECWQPNSDINYCYSCNSKRFQENFKNWTSGNGEVDTLIQESQLHATYSTGALEWIEYDRFYDVEFLAKGGFSTVHKAKWKDGYITSWNLERKRWNRRTDDKEMSSQEKYKKVILKVINNSQNSINSEFLNEFKLHQTMMINSPSVVKLYGMSKDTATNNYIIVMDLAENGSLRNYLGKNYGDILWDRKLYLLCEISNGLNEIHEKGLVHRNFHSGNIVIAESFNTYITDLGLNKPANVESNDKLFGVLPYMAPEVLKDGNYTRESDIYSFGMLAYEILSGYPPYHDKSHNELLAKRIRNGLRPQSGIKIPRLLFELICQCWDADPANRPTAKELLSKLQDYGNDYSNRDSKLFKQIDEADKYNNKLPASVIVALASKNPQAIYTSRKLNFIKILKPKQKRTWDETISDLTDLTIQDIELDDDDDDNGNGDGDVR